MRTCAACALVLIHLVACGRGEPAKSTASPSPAVTKTEPPVAPAGTAEPQPVQPTKPKVTQAARAQEAKAAAQPPQPAAAPPTTQAQPQSVPPAEAKPPAGPPPAAPKPVAPPPAAPKPPGIVVFPASFGKVTFDHAGHGKRNACAACHKTDPPAKIALAKDSAHAMCKGCHEQKAVGPTKCIGCHVK